MKWKDLHQSAAWLLWAALVVGVLAWVIAIKQYPFRDSTAHVEPILVGHPIGFAVVMANVFLFIAYFRRTPANIIRCVGIIILTVVMCFAATGREHELEQVRWEFDGTVVRKYRSDNHGYKSIEIRGKPCGQYELVEDSFWAAVQPGDRVVKKAYSVHALLNGERRTIVQGRLPSTARGRELE